MNSTQPNYITQIDVEVLRECWGSNDDVGIVLRTHMELERAMVRVLEVKYPNYKALNHWNFGQHLKSLRALGASGGVFQIADQVNKVRNRMAHVEKGAKTKLTVTDIDELCSQASGVFGGHKDVLGFAMGVGDEPEKPLREFSLGRQFAAIGFMAAAAIDTIPQREAATKTILTGAS